MTEAEFGATKWNNDKGLTDAEMGEVLEKSPVVIIHALVLQDKQLAHVPGSDVSGNFYRSAAVVFIINFDYLQEKHNRKTVSTSQQWRHPFFNTWSPVLSLCDMQAPV